MAKFVQRRDQFDNVCERIYRYIKIGAELPDVVLDKKFTLIRMAEFERVLCGDFLFWLLGCCKKIEAGKVWLMMLKPHPESFYYRRYGKFGLIEFNCDETVDEIAEIIDEYPEPGIANTIITIAEQFVVISEDEDWCIWGDRRPEAVVIGFADSEKYQLFNRMIPADERSMVMTPVEALDSFMAYPVSMVFSEYQKAKFIENYIAVV